MKDENARTRVLHERKLKALIDEYSKQGYEIFADFDKYPRPRRIGDFRPDLIVRKGDEEIVIEIASRHQMSRTKKKLESIAKYADRTRDARFDIVFTNPRPIPTKSMRNRGQRRLMKHLWQYLMKDVNAAYRRGQYDAAFYLLYDLLKSLFENVATAKETLPIGGKYTLEKLNQSLRKAGLINEEDYGSVKKLVIARNRMVHYGKRPGFEIDRVYLENARELAKALVRNLE